jgi:hypothetical protein
VWLHGEGYVKKVQVPPRDDGVRYVCTEKGREYLRKFHVREDLRRGAGQGAA